METFAFVALSFVLFAALGVGGYFYARKELQQTLKTHLKKVSTRENRRREEAKQLRADFGVLAENLKRIATDKKVDNLMTPFGEAPWKRSMEERAAKEAKEVVAVDNKLVEVRK
jgi:hypothetical protein